MLYRVTFVKGAYPKWVIGLGISVPHPVKRNRTDALEILEWGYCSASLPFKQGRHQSFPAYYGR
jgi:hypothetical protein